MLRIPRFCLLLLGLGPMLPAGAKPESPVDARASRWAVALESGLVPTPAEVAELDDDALRVLVPRWIEALDDDRVVGTPGRDGGALQVRHRAAAFLAAAAGIGEGAIPVPGGSLALREGSVERAAARQRAAWERWWEASRDAGRTQWLAARLPRLRQRWDAAFRAGAPLADRALAERDLSLLRGLGDPEPAPDLLRALGFGQRELGAFPEDAALARLLVLALETLGAIAGPDAAPVLESLARHATGAPLGSPTVDLSGAYARALGSLEKRAAR